jgi:predicted transcriptional regulator
MVRIVIDIEEYGEKLATKEAVAMALEQFGKVRVVQVIDGREETKRR